MKMQIKREIEFSTEELEQILIEYLDKEYRLSGDIDFTFKVVNKPYPCGVYDSCDRHEFDGVKIVIKTS